MDAYENSRNKLNSSMKQVKLRLTNTSRGKKALSKTASTGFELVLNWFCTGFELVNENGFPREQKGGLGDFQDKT